jgi:hypothetical protein
VVTACKDCAVGAYLICLVSGFGVTKFYDAIKAFLRVKRASGPESFGETLLRDKIILCE